MWSVWLEERGMVSKIIANTPRMVIGRPSKRDLPLPNSHWVRVQNVLAGISEEDLALIANNRQYTIPAGTAGQRRRYLGREVIGVVREIGADVTYVGVGDRVVLQHEAQSTCATLGLQPPCRACVDGNVALCEHRMLPWNGVGAGWSDSMIVHETQLFPVPDNLSNDQAVLLEPTARVVRCILQRTPQAGADVLVLGGGIMGQLTASALQAIIPGIHVTLATDATYQIEAAKLRDITAFLPLEQKELLQQGAEMTNAQTFRQGNTITILGGYDSVFVCDSESSLVSSALKLVRGGGTVVLVVPPNQSHQQINIDALWQDEITLLGIGSPGSEMLPDDMAESVGARLSSLAVAARLMLRTAPKRPLKTAGLITHRESYTAIKQALQIARQPTAASALRVVLQFD